MRQLVVLTMTSWRTLRVASDILSNSSMQQTPPSERTRAPLRDTESKLCMEQRRGIPLKYELLRIWVSCDVRCQTNRRGALAGRVHAARSELVDVLVEDISYHECLEAACRANMQDL